MIFGLALVAGRCDTPKFALPVNIDQIRAKMPSLTPSGEAMLQANGFVVLGDVGVADLHQAYPHFEHSGRVFVTTDAFLELWYELERKTSSQVEVDGLAPKLAGALPQLAARAAKLMQTAAPGTAQAARRAAVVFAVANRLVSPNAVVSKAIKADVDAELAKITAHSGASEGMDYTQFTVRGYYADSPTLTRYFLCSMWLSLNVSGSDQLTGAKSLLNAIAMAAALRDVPEARAAFADLNAVRSELAGNPNGISIEQLISALDAVNGAKWTLAKAVTPVAIGKLRVELAKAKYPSAEVHAGIHQPGEYPRKVIALLPQLATPDGVMFQRQVVPVGQRDLPEPLTVASALGSRAAMAATGATELTADQVRVASAASKPGSVYDAWLGLLATLNREHAGVYPFMRTNAWGYEKLNTQMASWSQLRHNFVLYAAQSYATMGGRESAPPAIVEPNPEFFRTLAATAVRLRGVFDRAGGLSSNDRRLIDELVKEAKLFARVSQAEIDGTVTDEDASAVEGFGDFLVPFEFHSNPAVCDVATGSTGNVLHVAAGKLNPIIVVPDPSNGVAYIGWCSSYYQLTRPNYTRMNDQQWGAIEGTAAGRAYRPAWATKFASLGGDSSDPARAAVDAALALLDSATPEEGLAALTRIADAHRESDAVAEGRLAAGRWLYERKRYDEAREMLLPNINARGGAVRDESLQRLSSIAYRTESDRFKVYQDSLVDSHAALIKAVDVAAHAEDATRRASEIQLVKAMTKATFSRQEGERAVAACKTQPWKDCVAYLAARFPTREFEVDASKCASALVAFARTAKSRPLAGAALAKAIELGYLDGSPTKQYALVAPYFDASVWSEATHPELALLNCETEPHYSTDSPKLTFQFALDSLKRKLVEDAIVNGHFSDLAKYEAIPTSDGRENEVPARGSAATAELITMTMNVAPHQEDRDLSVKMYERAISLNPHGRHVPYILWEMANMSDQPRAAESARRKLIMHFASTAPGLAARTVAALERLDFTAAYALIGKAMKQPREDFTEFFEEYCPNSAQSIKRDVDDEIELRGKIDDVIGSANTRKLFPTLISRVDRSALVRKIATAYPAQSVAALCAVGRWDECAREALSVLVREPNHPLAAKLWQVASSGSGDSETPTERLMAIAKLDALGEPYQFSKQVAQYLRQCLVTGFLESKMGNAALLHRTVPGSRAELVATEIAVRALIDVARPEDALTLAARCEVMPGCDEKACSALLALTTRALAEVAAKKQPLWRPLWTAKIGDTSGEFFHRDECPRIIAVNGIVIVPSTVNKAMGLSGFDAVTGKARWFAATGVPWSIQGGANRNVFAAFVDGRLISIDAQSGRVLFETPRRDIGNGDRSSRPEAGVAFALAGDKVILAASVDSSLTAIDAITGKTVWTKKLAAPSLRNITDRRLPVANSRLYVTDFEGKVSALDTDSGEILWKKAYEKRDDRDDPRQPIVLSPTRVAVPGERINLVDTATGTSIVSVREIYTDLNYTGMSNQDRKDLDKWWAQMATDHLDAELLPKHSSGGNDPEGTIKVAHVAYYGQSNFVKASSTETGALIAMYPLDTSYATTITSDDSGVYIFTPGGNLTAFPQVRVPVVAAR